jgi:hypothetical protein
VVARLRRLAEQAGCGENASKNMNQEIRDRIHVFADVLTAAPTARNRTLVELVSFVAFVLFVSS